MRSTFIQQEFSSLHSMERSFKEERIMKSYRKELWFHVPTRRAFVNITPKVEKFLAESGIM
jgi:hypothetical protein